LRHIILSQTCSNSENDGIEDSKVDNYLAKYNYDDLVKDDKLISGFSPSQQQRNGHRI